MAGIQSSTQIKNQAWNTLDYRVAVRGTKKFHFSK